MIPRGCLRARKLITRLRVLKKRLMSLSFWTKRLIRKVAFSSHQYIIVLRDGRGVRREAHNLEAQVQFLVPRLMFENNLSRGCFHIFRNWLRVSRALMPPSPD